MIPISLKLSNFTSYGSKEQELDFTKFKLAAISGPNGAGKSSLLDAITWCIWGTSRAGDSSDELVHSGANDMQVEFTFELDGHDFSVKRRRSKKRGGSTALELWSANGRHNLTEGTIKATQEKIISTLHLTFETFTNSSYLRQGHADEFTTKGPTDRKRILSDILGLDHYDKLEERAKEKGKEAQTKLQLLNYQLLEVEAELSQKEEREKKLAESKNKVTELENIIKNLEQQVKILAQQKELQQVLENQKKELEQIIAQGKLRAERINNLESRIKDTEGLEEKIQEVKVKEKEMEELRNRQQEKLELQKQIADLQGELNLKNHQKQVLEKEIEDLLKEVKALSIPGAKCPTCGQEIGKDQKHKVKKDLDKKLNDKKTKLSKISLEEESKQLKKLTDRLQVISFDEERMQKLKQSLTQLDSLQRQKELVLQDKASLETEKRVRQELLILYKNKHSQVNKIEENLEKLPKTSGDLQIKESELETKLGEEKEARSLLGQATELISRAQQLEKLQQIKKEEKKNLENEKSIYEELALAFGKKGIQAMIIETAIPEIEDEANRLLDRLTEGRMKVSLQTQRETKTKLSDGERGIIETLDIIISDEMSERLYEMYSGGEAFRVNFAIRLAVSKLLARRAGANLQFLVIDEGFGTQDAQGRGRIVEVLDSIKDDFEKILVITHLEELKEEFPVRIEVSKTGAGSTFEVVGI